MHFNQPLNISQYWFCCKNSKYGGSLHKSDFGSFYLAGLELL